MTAGMRRLLLTAAVLVFLAGLSLFVFPSRTDEWFAWTVQPSLTAAFLGASYWSSVAFELLAARARTWADARIAVPTVFVFTTLTLVATLLHLDRFHLDAGFAARPRVVAWAWLAIYVTVPVLMVVLWLCQRSLPGSDPPVVRPLPAWLAAVVSVQGVVLLAAGVALFAAPEDTARLWPWPLTPLTGRAVGAWLIGLGVAALHAVLEGCVVRLRPAAVAYLVFGVLQAVALARYPDTVRFGDADTLAYLAFLVSAVVVGAAALALTPRHPNAPGRAPGHREGGPARAAEGVRSAG